MLTQNLEQILINPHLDHFDFWISTNSRSDGLFLVFLIVYVFDNSKYTRVVMGNFQPHFLWSKFVCMLYDEEDDKMV